MFYEETKFKELLKCPKCHETLENPHVLPCCGESVCAKCLPAAVGGKCTLCGQTLDENSNNTFPLNKTLNRLFEMQPIDVYRGESMSALKLKIEAMRTQLERLKLDVSEPSAHKKIADHCDHLRNEVLARTVKAMESIRSISDNTIQKIDSYEKSCFESYNSSREAFSDELKQLETEYQDFRHKMDKSLSQSDLSSANLTDIITLAHRLGLKLESAQQRLLKLIFNRHILEYHECPNSVLGCLLVEKKLNPTYNELTPFRIKEDLLDSPDLLFTYFQIGFLKNGYLVLTISDGEIFKTIYVLDLSMCKSIIGYIVKKIDLYTKKSPIFDIVVQDDYIINSEFNFKTNSYQLACRDFNLSLLAKMSYTITDTLDVAVDPTSTLLYLLKHTKTVDVYRLITEKSTFELVRTINIATMCRRKVCSPCCACFWTTPASFDMEFKVRECRLFFKSANRIWMFDAKGKPEDGPIGCFSFRKQQQAYKNDSDESDISEVKRNVMRTNWFVNSKNEILVHLLEEKKLITFDISGEILFERDLNDFPNALKLSFCLDHHENVFFYDNENIYT